MVDYFPSERSQKAANKGTRTGGSEADTGTRMPFPIHCLPDTSELKERLNKHRLYYREILRSYC